MQTDRGAVLLEARAACSASLEDARRDRESRSSSVSVSTFPMDVYTEQG